MNMSMVEPAANTTIGAVATIIGRDGTDSISADLVAAWTSTINYEVVSRIHPRIPRIMR
jgi:alanine racemase